MIFGGGGPSSCGEREGRVHEQPHHETGSQGGRGARAVARPDRGVEPDRCDRHDEAPEEVRRHDRPARRLHVLHRPSHSERIRNPCRPSPMPATTPPRITRVQLILPMDPPCSLHPFRSAGTSGRRSGKGSSSSCPGLAGASSVSVSNKPCAVTPSNRTGRRPAAVFSRSAAARDAISSAELVGGSSVWLRVIVSKSE